MSPRARFHRAPRTLIVYRAALGFFYDSVLGLPTGDVFRSKLLAVLRAAWRAGELSDPPGERFDLAATDAWRKKWVVHVDPPEGRDPASLTKYLARYVRGVAVSDKRIVAMDDRTVTLQTRRGPVRMSGGEFVRRFAWHVLPKGMHGVRYYDLYAPNQSAGRAVQAWRLLQAAANGATIADFPLLKTHEPVCPKCGGCLGIHPIPGLSSLRPTRGPPPRAPP